MLILGLSVVNYQINYERSGEKEDLISSLKGKQKSRVFLVKTNPIQKNGITSIDAELWQNNHRIKGRLFFRDSLAELKFGDLISADCLIKKTKSSTNPHAFDFAQYAKFNEQYFSGFISDWNLIDYPAQTNWFYQTQRRLLNILNNHLNGEELAIASALVLGDKSLLNKQTKSSFSEAGAMHVLAVSGLHVGLVYLLLNFLLKPLERVRFGGVFKCLLMVSIIGIYAGITGFSPSVSRAAFMFALLAVGRLINRRASIYNILAVSAFVLLLINPLWLYSVSFQLSYVAIVGIVFIHPLLNELITPEFKIYRYVWDLICLSIAAQLATFPLALYYFGLFPTWFLPTNLIVVPAAFLELIGGFVLIILDPFPFSHFLGRTYSNLIHLINRSVRAIGEMPPGAIEVKIGSVELFLLYSIIISGAALLMLRRRVYLWISASVILFLFGFLAFDHHGKLKRTEMIVYESTCPLLELNNGMYSIIYSDTTHPKFEKEWEYIIEPSLKGRGVKHVELAHVSGHQDISISLKENFLVDFEKREVRSDGFFWDLNKRGCLRLRL